MKSDERIISLLEELTLGIHAVNLGLDRLATLWLEKEAKLTRGSKNAISVGTHSPMTPEQIHYAHLGNENKGVVEKL